MVSTSKGGNRRDVLPAKGIKGRFYSAKRFLLTILHGWNSVLKYCKYVQWALSLRRPGGFQKPSSRSLMGTAAGSESR